MKYDPTHIDKEINHWERFGIHSQLKVIQEPYNDTRVFYEKSQLNKTTQFFTQTTIKRQANILYQFELYSVKGKMVQKNKIPRYHN